MTTRRLAAKQLEDLVAIKKRIKSLSKELKAMVAASGPNLMELPGVGPIVAALALAERGRRDQVRRPEPVRLVDRHRAYRGVLPGAGPASM